MKNVKFNITVTTSITKASTRIPAIPNSYTARRSCNAARGYFQVEMGDFRVASTNFCIARGSYKIARGYFRVAFGDFCVARGYFYVVIDNFWIAIGNCNKKGYTNWIHIASFLLVWFD